MSRLAQADLDREEAILHALNALYQGKVIDYAYFSPAYDNTITRCAAIRLALDSQTTLPTQDRDSGGLITAEPEHRLSGEHTLTARADHAAGSRSSDGSGTTQERDGEGEGA